MRRRTFIGMCISAIAGAVVGKGARAELSGGDDQPAASAVGETDEESPLMTNREGEKVNPAEMVGYCGRLCMRCGVCGHMNAVDMQALQNVAKTIDMTGRAEKGLAWDVMRNMVGHVCREFDRDLESYAGFVQKGFPKCCRDHCVPPCQIAACCKEKGYRTCAECAEMETCDKLGKVRADMAPNLQAIRDKGLDAWAEEQWRTVTAEKKDALCKAIEEAYKTPETE